MGDAEENEALVLEVRLEGLWASPVSERCCIYRVPSWLHRVNPDVYTPRMLLIGPLHHSKKAKAAEFVKQGFLADNNEETKSKYLDYFNMEQQKQIYLQGFTERTDEETVIQFRETIKKEEEIIRQSYAESTAWIDSPEFVEMILLDSVFIAEFFLRCHDELQGKEVPGDLIMKRYCLRVTLFNDLILLENQLPYFLLEKLFNPVIKILYPDKTFRKLIPKFVKRKGEIKDTMVFKHFTDLLRCVRVETLDLTPENRKKKIMPVITHLDNVDKLDSAGVEFEPEENELSLDVKFEKGRLRIPRFTVHDETEKILRNIMALEQCHYPFTSYVSNYMKFLDFLIDTDKDVELLVEKGIIKNWTGQQVSVAEMINKLSLGVVEANSWYHDIANQLCAYRANPINRLLATLRRVYFADLWTGTATVAAVLLLLMTLVQTVASIIQVLQS